MKKLEVLAIVVSMLLTGCATLAPERSKAERLMGKDINDAMTAFGTPEMVLSNQGAGNQPDVDAHDHKVYIWERSQGSYTRGKLVSHEFDTSNGHPEIVDTYQSERVNIACRIMLWANKSNIVDYYDIKGDCGFWGMGFGNTGSLHKYGIN